MVPLCVPTLGSSWSLPALGLCPPPPVVEAGAARGGPLAGAECWQGLSPAGHSVGHAIESAPAPRASTAQRASQTHGNHSGQRSHSSLSSHPGPPVCALVVHWLLFHSAEMARLLATLAASSAAARIIGLQRLLGLGLGVARNWGLFSSQGDCPQGHHL